VNLIKRIKLAWIGWRARKEMAAARSLSQRWAALKALAGPPPADFPFPPYPANRQTADVARFVASIKRWRKANPGRPLRLVFGDSIAAFTRNYLTDFPADTNCAQAGSGFPNFETTAQAIRAAFAKAEVQAVLIGCGGNGGLGGQSLDTIRSEALLCLAKIRELFPRARVIVYGWPPVYDLYAASIAPAVEATLLYWVIADGNATFVPLQKHFAGFLGLFPRIRYSSDGVHLAPEGVRRFDELVSRALRAPAGSVVD
jgi:hypothetical protein